jgi:NitT/TauT family transport system substrate-binding protein
MSRHRSVLAGLAPALVLSLVAAAPASAKDKVRWVDSQAMVYDAFSAYIAQFEGFFDAENLDVSIIVGRGGADALQAVVTGSQDIVYAPGTLSVIAAYAKGAPITIVGNAKYGASEIFWYVPKDSPIRSLKELDGKDLVFSNQGSVTHMLVQTVARELGINPKFVSVGPVAASRTQVMSGQVQTGWSTFPALVDLLRSGEIRKIGSGDDAKALRDASIRSITANTNWLKKNRDVATRAMRATYKAQQFLFQNEAGPRKFAEHWKVDVEDAKRFGEFFKLEDHTFMPIGQLDRLIAMAVEYGFIREPLTAEQKKGLVTVVYDPKKPG